MRFFIILIIFVSATLFDSFGKTHGPIPGYQVNAAVIKHRRIKNNEKEAKEMDHEYSLGKIGGDKTFHFGKKEDEDPQNTKNITEGIKQKKILFSCALDEIENYPIIIFSEDLHTIITDYYAPYANKVAEKTDSGKIDKREWKVEIRIAGSDMDPELKVRAFTKSKYSPKIVEDKPFAAKIKENIFKRYKRKIKQ